MRTPRPQEGGKKRKKKKKTERTQNLKRRQPGVRIWGLAVDQAAAAADFPSILLGCNSLCSGSPGLCWPVPGSQEGGCPSCMQSCSCARLCLVRGRVGAWLMWQESPEGKTKKCKRRRGKGSGRLGFPTRVGGPPFCLASRLAAGFSRRSRGPSASDRFTVQVPP